MRNGSCPHSATSHSISGPTGTDSRRSNLIPLREASWAWCLISLQTFGGPAGQIAVMQRTLVDEKRWIGQKRFLHALTYCMLLPGPEAQQLAIYTGWLLNGTMGGLIAGVLFVLPGMIAMLGLAAIYVAFGTTIVLGIFAGIAPAVLAVVVQAVTRVAQRALSRPAHWDIAVSAFFALALFAVPFPIVIAVAGFAGWLIGRRPSNDPGDLPPTAGPLIMRVAIPDRTRPLTIAHGMLQVF